MLGIRSGRNCGYKNGKIHEGVSGLSCAALMSVASRSEPCLFSRRLGGGTSCFYHLCGMEFLYPEACGRHRLDRMPNGSQGSRPVENGDKLQGAAQTKRPGRRGNCLWQNGMLAKHGLRQRTGCGRPGLSAMRGAQVCRMPKNWNYALVGRCGIPEANRAQCRADQSLRAAARPDCAFDVSMR